MFPIRKPHTFHIPVMGTGFTADSPVKVAQYGINSVISLSDDIMLEKLREFYCKAYNLVFEPVNSNLKDAREKRITLYLNLIDQIVKDKFANLKKTLNDKNNSILIYIEMLPEMSLLKKEFYDILNKALDKYKKTEPFINNISNFKDIFTNNNHNICIKDLPEVETWVNNNLIPGAIDVNIMTKVDKDNFFEGQQLPVEYNDAHAAAAGFAKSNLSSSLVLSAGMNPRLYSFLEQFDDFYPDNNGKLKKHIIIKVSDYRSAIIQGKYLAKKGLWVSEFRIESGLNCGGHAFATDGLLMGPILEEFKNSKKELTNTLFEIYSKTLSAKGKNCPEKPFYIKITAQGGIGTSEEHNFLLDYYNLDSIGWGTPFLLVPEVTNMDNETRELLINADEEQLYLSNISPLGVPFYNLRGNFQDIKKHNLILKGTPGSVCSKQYLRINRGDDYGNLCPASRAYQKRKIKALDQMGLNEANYKIAYDKIVEKACLCHGLANAARKKGSTYPEVEGNEISVCPGPNMAYFSKITTLQEMVSHIYGRIDIIDREDRPHVFIKELEIYLLYLQDKIKNYHTENKDVKSLTTFKTNLLNAIDYYLNLFKPEIIIKYKVPESTVNELNLLKDELLAIDLDKTFLLD